LLCSLQAVQCVQHIVRSARAGNVNDLCDNNDRDYDCDQAMHVEMVGRLVAALSQVSKPHAQKHTETLFGSNASVESQLQDSVLAALR
jgi:hypothetical protein